MYRTHVLVLGVNILVLSIMLLVEPGTPTWKGEKNHRSSTIYLVITSNTAQVSMAEIASNLYTGSDHETLCSEINEGGSDE
jgi:hypothetical protein